MTASEIRKLLSAALIGVEGDTIEVSKLVYNVAYRLRVAHEMQEYLQRENDELRRTVATLSGPMIHDEPEALPLKGNVQ